MKFYLHFKLTIKLASRGYPCGFLIVSINTFHVYFLWSICLLFYIGCSKDEIRPSSNYNLLPQLLSLFRSKYLVKWNPQEIQFAKRCWWWWLRLLRKWALLRRIIIKGGGCNGEATRMKTSQLKMKGWVLLLQSVIITKEWWYLQ